MICTKCCQYFDGLEFEEENLHYPLSLSLSFIPLSAALADYILSFFFVLSKGISRLALESFWPQRNRLPVTIM